MKRLIFLSVVLLLASQVRAQHTVEYGVFDFNTLDPVYNASVKVYNNSVLFNSTLTGVDGYGSLWLNETRYYVYESSKSGYLDDLSSSTISTNETILIYLIPASNNGIVRLIGGDLTLGGGSRRFYIFYTENNRLHGQYRTNDTITLLINRGYIVKPEVNKMDVFSSPSNVKNYGQYYVLSMFGLSSLLIVAAVAVGLLMYGYARFKRR